jgi:serine/threonine-protein kinase HSL1 (negative regulator of Swe1 kinase)
VLLSSLFIFSLHDQETDKGRACYEKVFYNKLLKYRDEQLENYQGHVMEFSTSDYHHITKPSMRRSSTRASMHARGHIRNKSVFSIKDEPNRRPSYASGRQPSEPETVQSYDPYRSSRTQIANNQADHARITVLRGQVDFPKGSRSASGTPSFRAPSLGRVKSGAVYSISSSPPPLPANLNGRPLTLRREHLVRNYSRTSSIASSRLSYRNSASGRFKASAGYRRSVSFNHARRESNGGLEPTPRVSKAPQSIPLREKYLSDEQSRANYNHLSPAEGPSPKSDLSPQVRSRKEKPTKSIAEDIIARKSKRASIYWKEEARKISSELENLCDEAFNPPFVPMEPSTSAATAAGPNNMGQGSLDVPVANEARFAPSTIVKPHRNIVPDRLRPLPKPPLKDHIDTKAQDELAKAKELLVKRAQDLSPGALDEVIAQIDRLMQQRNLGLSTQEYERRIASAPIAKSLDPRLLSPVKEAEEHRGRKGIDYQDYRAASLPTGTTQNDSVRPLTRRGDENKSTVRLVDHSPVPRPAPLVIRKRSADSNNKAYANADDSRPVSYHHSGALEPIHNGEALRSRSRLGSSKDRGSTGTALLDLSLNPIFEDENKENSDPLVAKRESGDSRKKGWFRKRWSDRSHESDGPPSPLPKDDIVPQLPYGRTAYGKENKSEKRASDVPSEESRHSEPSHENAGKGIFFKIFSKRDTKASKRVSELALTGKCNRFLLAVFAHMYHANFWIL